MKCEGDPSLRAQNGYCEVGCIWTDIPPTTVQEDLGPHWTNSGYQLTSSLDLDADKLAPSYICRVSIEFITIVLQYIVFISIMSHGQPE